MFEEFYNFTSTPFSRTIPTKNLYRGNDSDELVERLKYTAARQLFAVLIGDSGTGKTTTLRRFFDEIHERNHFVMYLSDSRLTPRLFYKSLLEQLGFEAKHYSSEAKRQLHKEIEIMKAMNGVLPVAIVDEAHLLNKEMLEEIRFLMNFKMDSQSPMALILSGQTELWDKLKLQAYAAIRQRIDVQCVVGRLDRAQTAEYISAQLNYASLFNKIMDCLDCWDVSDYDPLFRPTFADVLFALTHKKQSIELRDAYSKIINAESEQDLFDARMRYLLKKREHDNFF